MPIPVSSGPSAFTVAVMVAYCHWDPTAVVTGEQLILDGNGTRHLMLPSLHVTDVTAVTVTYSDGSTYAATIGPGGDVGWNDAGELVWLPSSLQTNAWPEGIANVAVTYSGGYTTTPADLAAALASIDARLPKIQSGLQNAKIGTASMTYAAQVAAGGLLLVEQMVLDRYRIMQAA